MVRLVKPMKIAALIVSAIQDLRETKGSTPKKIIGYISYASDMGEGRVKRQVKSALRRGVEYGILRKYRGNYFLPTGDEIDRANRIALRFSKLPLPPTQSTKSDSPRKMIPLGSQKRSNKYNTNLKKTKRLIKVRSPLISPSVSLVDAICEINENTS
ncbi:uncharacterized protein LOC116435167 [Nomia melanderi]|uniref:uncharacterized protein LOC116435167 n=1 Tax=Nomia melanderi TaxID=2448451 RepID=UPI0013043F54|nr:uncharacterized protein LOC116435167 [Nomia melanderi]